MDVAEAGRFRRGGDVADAAARLLKSFAECFDEAIDEAKAKVKK